jgi:hypothetical protein
VFDNYFKGAIQVMFLGRVEARTVASEMMDSEHVLIGIMRVDPVLLRRLVSVRRSPLADRPFLR